jgi:hypothetical protein
MFDLKDITPTPLLLERGKKKRQVNNYNEKGGYT